jgi:hypothetical protein
MIAPKESALNLAPLSRSPALLSQASNTELSPTVRPMPIALRTRRALSATYAPMRMNMGSTRLTLRFGANPRAATWQLWLA